MNSFFWRRNTIAVEASSGAPLTELPWYRWWLYQQIRSQPQRLFLALPNMNGDDDSNWDSVFLPLLESVKELVVAQASPSIDGIMDALVELGTLSVDHNYEAHQTAKQLIFAIIGWQTMLYKPNLPPYISGDFAIVDETDGYRGETQVCLVQLPHSGKQDLPRFLLGYGLMLPPRNYCAFNNPDDQKLFQQTKAITPKDLNAHVLTKVCGVRIQWVDSLSCHLELDRQSGTLFLYRYPSFCVSTLQRQKQRSTKQQLGDIIHRCGLQESGAIPWASEKDIVELLEEILLSYRLLFGQSTQSRHLFRQLQPFAGIPSQGHDQFLSAICGKSKCPMTLIERDEYDMAGDFPHLRSRMVLLNSYASSKRPRSILQLWRDKRDSTAWIAFWSVLILGSAGIFLGVVQTVFQILQFVQGLKHE
ncbi:hypothetical protein ACQKWADRAFT_213731 [Trichoderma austrokoningii]